MLLDNTKCKTKCYWAVQKCHWAIQNAIVQYKCYWAIQNDTVQYKMKKTVLDKSEDKFSHRDATEK